MQIFYVHHALRKKGNPPSQEDGLEPLGKRDAKFVAKLFLGIKEKRGSNIVAIYTSSYFRCKETAKLINKYIKVPIIEDERLNEFVSKQHAKNYGWSEDKAETWLDCQKRMRECIKDIVFKHDEKDVAICVTSGVNISAFISLAYKIKPSKNLPYPAVPSCSPIGFDIDKSCFEKKKDE